MLTFAAYSGRGVGALKGGSTLTAVVRLVQHPPRPKTHGRRIVCSGRVRRVGREIARHAPYLPRCRGPRPDRDRPVAAVHARHHRLGLRAGAGAAHGRAAAARGRAAAARGAHDDHSDGRGADDDRRAAATHGLGRFRLLRDRHHPAARRRASPGAHPDQAGRAARPPPHNTEVALREALEPIRVARMSPPGQDPDPGPLHVEPSTPPARRAAGVGADPEHQLDQSSVTAEQPVS